MPLTNELRDDILRRSRACARSRSRYPVMVTAPTIWCRRRCCARSPTSTRSSPAPTFPRGCSPSCATCFAPTTANGAAKSRMPRQLCQDAEEPAVAGRASGVRGIPRGAGKAAAGPARSVDPGGRIRLLLRGCRGDLRLRGRHYQEPRQPRALEALRAALCRQRRGFRSRQHRARRDRRQWRIKERDAETERRPDRAAFCFARDTGT